MNRKFLALSCAVILSCTLTSCKLKDMVNGAPDTEDSTTTQLTTDKNADGSTDATTDDTTSTDNNSTELTNNDSTIVPTENKESAIDTSTTGVDDSTTVSSNSTTRNCRIFYFNGTELKTYYVDTTVTVIDNAFVTALTSKLHESPNSNSDYLIIPDEIGVSSASLDADTGVLNVVFNENFTDTMTLGTSTESGLISALVNTYGYNYGVDKVAIYFGDDLYTGLKGELPEGYYSVNYSDAIKLN